jgi:ribosome-binding factor A
MESDNKQGGSRRPGRRPERMADLIREEVASFILNGVKDPRIGFVTITMVKVTPDLQTARIYYSAYGSDKEKKETAEGLEESKGQVRNHLARRMTARYTPKIEFFIDEGLEQSYRVQELLGKVSRGEDVPDDADDQETASVPAEEVPDDDSTH